MSLRFNLDLNVIETVLTDAGIKVEPALAMPALLKKSLQSNKTFVLPLDELAEQPDEIGGIDVQQRTMERFAVVGAFKSIGDKSGTSQKNALQEWRENVKTALVGVVVSNFDAITFEAGKLVEMNTEKQNILYQLQFATSQTVVSNVRNVDE